MAIGKVKRGRLAEINITPLVDVMLVLMIVFLVTAPMLHYTVDINLPSNKTIKPLENHKINLLLDSEGQIFWNEKPLQKSQLLLKISQIKEDNSIVYFAADKDISYQKVMEILQIFIDNSVENVVLVTKE